MKVYYSKVTLWKLYCVDGHTIAGYFFQLDTIVYPRSKAKPTYLTQLPGKVWSLLSGSKSTERKPPQVDVLQCSIMLEMSLSIHLQPTHDILLQGSFRKNYNIALVANRIIDLFNLFMSRTVYSTYLYMHTVKQRRVRWQDPSVKKVGISI